MFFCILYSHSGLGKKNYMISLCYCFFCGFSLLPVFIHVGDPFGVVFVGPRD